LRKETAHKVTIYGNSFYDVLLKINVKIRIIVLKEELFVENCIEYKNISKIKYVPLVIFQLKARIEKNTSMSIQKRSVMEQTMPSLVTGTGLPNTSVNRNHGKGNLEQN
jgi:hypothetical protein